MWVIFDVFKTLPVCLNDYTVVSIYTLQAHGLQMTHCAPGFHAVLQSPAVKEVLKDQDGRKGLIAAICAGTNQSDNYTGLTSYHDAFLWGKV